MRPVAVLPAATYASIAATPVKVPPGTGTVHSAPVGIVPPNRQSAYSKSGFSRTVTLLSHGLVALSTFMTVLSAVSCAPEAMLYAPSGSVLSAGTYEEWYVLERGYGWPPRLCVISWAMTAPVLETCAGVLPTLGLSETARATDIFPPTAALPSAQPWPLSK